MDTSENLSKLRDGIDDIDRQLLDLFSNRMDLCNMVADLKMRGDLPVADENREAEILAAAESRCPEYREEALALMRVIIGLSKDLQSKYMDSTQWGAEE
jgi:chorismate mutase/prephenate dehydratase